LKGPFLILIYRRNLNEVPTELPQKSRLDLRFTARRFLVPVLNTTRFPERVRNETTPDDGLALGLAGFRPRFLRGRPMMKSRIEKAIFNYALFLTQ